MVQFDYKNFLATLPNGPGVYKMYGEGKELLYVGKAVDLKKRVSSYFKANRSGKIERLVDQITEVQFVVTTNEIEALLLESNLIKTKRPKYNVLLRDDKSYPFILLSNDPIPQLRIYRGQKTNKVKGKLFGPFPSTHAVREAIDLIVKIFKLRTCSNSFFKNRSRACLEYQINRCSAPCVKLIDKESYLENVKQVILLLKGKSDSLISELSVLMLECSKSLEYEKAQFYRDKIRSIQQLLNKQIISQERGDFDVIALVLSSGILMGSVVSIENGEVINTQTFQLDYPKSLIDLKILNQNKALYSEATSTLLTQYYLEDNRRLPKTLLLAPFDDYKVFISALEATGRSVTMKFNLQGKQLKWFEFAKENALAAIDSQLKHKDVIYNRLQELQSILEIKKPISRIECFDVSHTQGHFTVASCVVFTQLGATPKDYRTYNIKGITRGDDYAAMNQVLTRRFSPRENGVNVLPDVILIDGGLGQLKVARDVLESLNLENIMLIAVAKGPTRKSGLEQLLLLGNEKPLDLAINSQARHLIQFIRDESHRFAIKAHRNQIKKTMSLSQLEDIEGIGPKRRQQLIKHFGSLKSIQRGSVDDIASIKGISLKLAKAIKKALD